MITLLSLLDDIASTLDDVSVMTKIALKKTSALMSDDLAVNAGVIDGVHPDRELPIVKKIFLGSLINKLICIAGVLLLGTLYPPLITGILVLGGLYLSFEGVHKIFEKLEEKLHPNNLQKKVDRKELTPDQRAKGAIRTDLILSIEIIVIAKTNVTGDLLTQLFALTIVGFAASLIIYGLVAIIVKIDDFGLFLIKKGKKKVGLLFVSSMPIIMKVLGVVGTIAMLLVGGGIFNHTFHLSFIPGPELLQNLILGSFAGVIIVAIEKLIKKLFIS